MSPAPSPAERAHGAHRPRRRPGSTRSRFPTWWAGPGIAEQMTAELSGTDARSRRGGGRDGRSSRRGRSWGRPRRRGSLHRGGITVTVEVAAAPDLPPVHRHARGRGPERGRGPSVCWPRPRLGVEVHVEPFFDEEAEQLRGPARDGLAASAPAAGVHRQAGRVGRDMGEPRPVTTEGPNGPATAEPGDDPGTEEGSPLPSTAHMGRSSPSRSRLRLVGKLVGRPVRGGQLRVLGLGLLAVGPYREPGPARRPCPSWSGPTSAALEAQAAIDDGAVGRGRPRPGPSGPSRWTGAPTKWRPSWPTSACGPKPRWRSSTAGDGPPDASNWSDDLAGGLGRLRLGPPQPLGEAAHRR